MKEYKTFARCFADQYSQVTVLGGLHVSMHTALAHEYIHCICSESDLLPVSIYPAFAQCLNCYM